MSSLATPRILALNAAHALGTLVRALVLLPLVLALVPALALRDLGRAGLERRRHRRYLRRQIGLELLVATSDPAVEPAVYAHVIPELPDVALVYEDGPRLWTDLPRDVTTRLLREAPTARPLVGRVGSGGVVSWKTLDEELARCREGGAPELLGPLAVRKLASLRR